MNKSVIKIMKNHYFEWLSTLNNYWFNLHESVKLQLKYMYWVRWQLLKIWFTQTFSLCLT